MKTLLASLVLVALLGCGSNDSSSPNDNPAGSASIVGSWVDVIDSSTALVINFTSTTWKGSEVVQMTDGTYGVQIDSGTYSISGSTLTLVKTASSCQGVTAVTKASTDTFSRQGDHLTLTTSSALLAFQLDTTPPVGMGAARIGCVSNGKFVFNPITTVP